MMKIDVEGWESRVLAGGREALARADAPVLQVEFVDEGARAAGSSCRILFECLEAFGYRLFTYDPSKRELIPERVRDEYPFINLIAAKDPEFVNARLRVT
jgi:hypothetical protein